MLQTKSIGKSYLSIANGLVGTTHVTLNVHACSWQDKRQAVA